MPLVAWLVASLLLQSQASQSSSLFSLARTGSGYRVWSACRAVDSRETFLSILPRARGREVTDTR